MLKVGEGWRAVQGSYFSCWTDEMLPTIKREKYSLIIIFKQSLTVMKKRTENKLTLQTRKRGGESRIELKCFIFYGRQSKDTNIGKSRNRSVTYFL